MNNTIYKSMLYVTITFLVSFGVISNGYTRETTTLNGHLKRININPYYAGMLDTFLEVNSFRSKKKLSKLIDPPKNGETKANLKMVVNEILSMGHLLNEGGEGKVDKLVENCSSQNESNCKIHTPLSYEEARSHLFGAIHLEENDRGDYFIRDIYCLKNFGPDDFNSAAQAPYPMRIPDGNVINTEHVWPQSRFRSGSGGGKNKKNDPQFKTKVSDLHILYPSTSKINTLRGNLEFAETIIEVNASGCSSARIGRIANDGKNYFDPPVEYRGRIARALFYFSTRYLEKINPVEEKFIRKWHKEYPVTADEMKRNEEIYKLEMVRNPFVDLPELVDLVQDF